MRKLVLKDICITVLLNLPVNVRGEVNIRISDLT